MSSSAGQPVHFIPAKNHRFLFLDALRGIAAVFVIFFHLPASTIHGLATNGFLSVDFFFCLSGFVIAFSYEKRLETSLSLKDFTVARLIRLYPLYLLGSVIGLLISALVHQIAYGTGQSWSHWITTFTFGIFLWPARLSPVQSQVNFPLDIPAWSLFYELVANLIFALLIKFRAAGSAAIGAIAAVSFAILGLYAVKTGNLDLGNACNTFGMGFARVGFSFSAGVLLFRLYRSDFNKDFAVLKHWVLCVFVAISVIAILVAPIALMKSTTFRLSAICIWFPSLVYLGAITKLPHFLAGLSAVLGEISYPLYLLHGPFILTRRFHQYLESHSTIAPAIIFLSVTALAIASWWAGRYIDSPVRRFLTKRYNLLNNKISVTT
ncbi:acyltransferase family protein [Edaphobacter aggregans]|uniref:acyltransferase family protein n=1 Tax=Edaphobacter aggregans TaxID=570835 RepID=UPI0005562DB9|nr:acyltransferase [Edaphobacter aggregans]